MGISAVNPFLNYQQPQVGSYNPVFNGSVGKVQGTQQQVQTPKTGLTYGGKEVSQTQGIDIINANQDIFSAINEAKENAGYQQAGLFNADNIFANSKDGEAHPKFNPGEYKLNIAA